MLCKLTVFLRASLFNIFFFGGTFIACLICLPALLLSDRQIRAIIHTYIDYIYFIEKYILGLNYEVRGLENLPQNEAYIVAAKHQSAYETFKLHYIFGNPAIILKEELVKIPIWGRFLSKLNPIAIDRANAKKALSQMIEGAKHVKEDNRALVIFPQGTRVYPNDTPETKPYKNGIVRIARETDMKIIPMALNSGVFWPRRGWIKKGGTVIFSILPPLETDIKNPSYMTELAQKIENETNKLIAESVK